MDQISRIKSFSYFFIKLNFNESLLMPHKILKTLSTTLLLKLLKFGHNSLWGRDDMIMNDERHSITQTIC